MPGWHEATKELQMLGFVEQHPDRCRLFMQWKQMDWPSLVDSLDLLEIGVVPMTVSIDEHGIVRHADPTDGWSRFRLGVSYRARLSSKP